MLLLFAWVGLLGGRHRRQIRATGIGLKNLSGAKGKRKREKEKEEEAKRRKHHPNIPSKKGNGFGGFLGG
jgi:hypothetical protein